MSKQPFFVSSLSSLLATVLVVASAITAQTQVLGLETGHRVPWVRLDGYTQADGTNAFALTLPPAAEQPALRGHPRVPANGPRDVVILVSTAASQTGDYRAKSLATLRSLLSKLDANDRVKLVAFDLNAIPLTPEFVAPNSPQMAAALTALDHRTPLGSCDLETGLETAARSYSGDSKSARAIVYMGDGSSRANPLTIDRLDRIVNDLVTQRAPVIAFGVGPRLQEQLLGTLVARSGGVLVPENAVLGADFYGTGLAQAVHASVLWPQAADKVKWPEDMDVYPRTLPPLRSDRDTVLVGATKSGHPVPWVAPKQVEIDVDGPAGAQELVFDIPELKPDANNYYLVSLLDQAKVDGGRTLPLIDSGSLATAKEEIEAGGRGLSDLAFKALHGGNLDSADKLAGEALSRNPNDLVAREIKDAVAAKKAGGGPLSLAVGVAAKVVDPPPLPGAPGDLNLQGGDAAAPPPAGAAAESEIQQANALEERWQKEVEVAINKARSLVAEKPDEAEKMLQQITANLAAVTELRPEMRDRLMGQLRAASREIRRRKEEYIHREQARIREEAARKEEELVNAALQRDQSKVDQLMRRFDSLLEESRQRLSEQAADQAAADAQTSAAEADKIVTGNMPSAGPTMRVAMHTARFLGAYDDIMAVRVARQKGYVDAMYQTEKAHVPTPDDPPIVYPDAEVWKELTARRREKYSSTELSQHSPVEKKIEEALKQPTQIEFVETPLKDVVDYLKDLHHIEIQLDSAALKDAGVDESTTVTRNIKGISLRSALKLLLDDLQLTYVIHDEVLLITSPTKAESDEYMTTKVYPVADLVLPIKDFGFMGGFGGMGGMMGGMGDTMGGMGGMMGGMGMGGMGMGGMGMGGMGMGGMGMGGMGMGGMGMGGGMFNVPREVLP